MPWLCQYVIEAPPPDTYTLATAGSAESGANCGLNRKIGLKAANGMNLWRGGNVQ